MSDDIDREVNELFEEMELSLGYSEVLAEAGESIKRALQEIDEARQKASETIQNAIAALGDHYISLKEHDEYQKIVATLAGLDMILTPGFQLAVRMETENLGHVMTPAEMFGLLTRIFSDLDDPD